MYEDLVKRLMEMAVIIEHCSEQSCSECENKELCDKYDNKTLSGTYKEAADAIEELSRRETPMRLRITTSTKRCPSCNKQVSGIGNIHGNYRYCRWCGQAIDWSEPPKEET